ncbi:MAG: substrate-binding domain-containing protein [Spirochaetales bacterium]|nr:substrate-binding domain-containing protein [Spirochaetales bacterium]
MNIKKMFLSFLACLVLFSGCSKKEANKSAENQDKKNLTIGFSIDSFVIERWRRDCDIFIAAAKEYGASVIVQNAGNSIEEQIKQIKYLIDMNVDVLVIVPKNASSLTDVIQKAHAKNIPVVSYDRLILDAPIDLYVTIDSRKVGLLMAEELCKIKPKGSWFAIYGAEEDHNMQMLKDGVMAAIKLINVRKNHHIEVGMEFFTAGWNYDLAYKKMNEMLEAQKIPQAVICGNDAIAENVLRSLSEHRINDVAVSGQDADIAACQRIVENKQSITVYKPITQLAKCAAECACILARGKPNISIITGNNKINNGFSDVPVLWLDPQVVTKDNIEDVIIKNGFHTREEVYRNIDIAEE